MNDAQGWTLIIGFFAIVMGGFTLQARLIRSEVDRMAEKVRVEIAQLSGELKAAVSRIDAHLERLERDR